MSFEGLIGALKIGNLVLVRQVLSQNPGCVNLYSNFGESPLLVAAGLNEENSFLRLFSKEIPLNEASTPAALAATHLEMINLLLAAGADPLATGRKGVICYYLFELRFTCHCTCA